MSASLVFLLLGMAARAAALFILVAIWKVAVVEVVVPEMRVSEN